jgi:SAM-dependent methyltransferase
MRDYGWEVEGLEPDPVAAERLRKSGIKVTEGTLPSNVLKEASFDVITASHVIEHVPNPLQFLIACFKLLRSNGRLVVATPNAKSAGLKKHGRSWVHLDAPRHFIIFTPQSLADSLRSASFQIEHVTTSCRSAFFATKTSRLLERGAMRIGFGSSGSLVDKISAIATFIQEGLVVNPEARQEIVVVGRKGNH